MSKNYSKVFLSALCVGWLTAAAQSEQPVSSSVNLGTTAQSDITLPFSLTAEGTRFTPVWGLDQAWINESNLRKGLNHMGRENVGIGRSAFRTTKALTGDSVLASDQTSALRERSNIFNIVSDTLPLVLTADQEAGSDPYFVVNKSANVEHWAACINSHVHWMQQNTKHPIIGVSPFNEPDYWTVEEGATTAKHRDVARLLKENYPRFADIAIVGGNTLNNDMALSWYNAGKQYYDWGNTHQLAGSFDNFAAFYQRLQKDGKVGYGDEMHNVGEAMIGLEYGMTVGIWWGFDSRARGEFCDISRHGCRLAYGEHRNNWTAASVYRHDDGRVKAFIGSSERQAVTTSYQLVSLDHEVYYDGHGPLREFRMEMPGGTGYQKGQTNAERVIDITWGEDVAPAVIDGNYRIVNKATGNVVVPSNGNIVQQKASTARTQQWHVYPSDSRIGGDFSFLNIESVTNAKMRMNVLNFSKDDNADILAYAQNDTPSSNEQWYLQYAGDGYYYIRNRESALYLTSASSYSMNNVKVVQRSLWDEDKRDRQLWRILPVDVTYETKAPAQPVGLSAQAQTASVLLSWDANKEQDLDGYMVLRADASTAQWNTIARKVKGTAYVDNTCRQGHTYYYKVKAIDRSDNFSAASEAVHVTLSVQNGLMARWPFNGDVADVTHNAFHPALTQATPDFVEGPQEQGGKALSLTGKDYVQLPYEVAGSDELTVAMWVNWQGGKAWQRLFDFGYDTDHYFFLTPSNGSIMRFAIKNGGSEQVVNCPTALATKQWKHVTVTLGKERVAVYVDGKVVANATGITLSPADVHPVLNYLGRSQFTGDPMLNASVADVRIYNYALTADEVSQVMSDDASGISDAMVNQVSGRIATYTLGGRKTGGTTKGIVIGKDRKYVVK